MPISAGSVRDIPVRAVRLGGLTWAGQLLWYAEEVTQQLVALDLHSELVHQRLSCPLMSGGLTTIAGSIVQVSGANHDLRVIDPDTGKRVDEIPNPRPGYEVRGIEATPAGLWMGYPELRIAELRDPGSMRLLDTVHLMRQARGVTASDHYLAYSHQASGTINLVDIELGREVASYDVVGTPIGLTWDGSRIWYCDTETLQIRAVGVLGITR